MINKIGPEAIAFAEKMRREEPGVVAWLENLGEVKEPVKLGVFARFVKYVKSI